MNIDMAHLQDMSGNITEIREFRLKVDESTGSADTGDGGDSVEISQEARDMLAATRAETENAGAKAGNGENGATSATGAVAEEEDEGQTPEETLLEKLYEQLAEAQEKVQEAQEKLVKATNELSKANNDSEKLKAKTEVEAAQLELTLAQTQVAKISTEIQDLLKRKNTL